MQKELEKRQLSVIFAGDFFFFATSDVADVQKYKLLSGFTLFCPLYLCSYTAYTPPLGSTRDFKHDIAGMIVLKAAVVLMQGRLKSNPA